MDGPSYDDGSPSALVRPSVTVPVGTGLMQATTHQVVVAPVQVTRDYAQGGKGNYLGGLRVDKSGICEITKWLAIQIEFVMRGWSRIAS